MAEKTSKGATERLVHISLDEMRNANIPEKFWRMEVSERNSPSILNQIQTVTDNLHELHRRGHGVMLMGQPMSGKTFWLTYLLKAVVGITSQSAYYVSMHSLVDDYFEGGETKAGMTSIINSTQWLGIDNLGETENDGYRLVLHKVLRARVDRGVPTLIAVNASGKQHLKDLYGEQLAEMMEQHCHPVRLLQKADRFDTEREKVRKLLLPTC